MFAKLKNWLFPQPRKWEDYCDPPIRWPWPQTPSLRHPNLHGLTPEQRSARTAKGNRTRAANKARKEG